MKKTSGLIHKPFLDWLNSSSTLFGILIVICCIAAILSFLLYDYLSYSSMQIEKSSIYYITTVSINNINDLKNIIQDKLEVIYTNLELLSNAERIRTQDVSAITFLQAAQRTTPDLTNAYAWFDENGKLVWSTSFSGNMTSMKLFDNYDSSGSPYFQIPKETFQPYFDNILSKMPNAGNNQVFVISYPILDLKSNSGLNDNFKFTGNQSYDRPLHYSDLISLLRKNGNDKSTIDFIKKRFEFKGVVIAAIDNTKFEHFVKNAISVTNNNHNTTTFTSNSISANDDVNKNVIRKIYPSLVVTLFDKYGKVLSSNSPQIIVGSKYNSSESIKKIRDQYNEEDANKIISTLNSIFNSNGKTNEYYTKGFPNQFNGITLDLDTKPDKQILDTTRFIANYRPIISNGNPVLYLFTATPITSGEIFNQQMNNQIAYTFLFIVCILSLVFSFILIVIILHKRLKLEVMQKTSQLLENVNKLKETVQELSITKKSLEETNKRVSISNEKLMENDEKQKEFINTAAHELRTPVQAISGYCEMNEEMFNALLRDDIIQTNQNMNGEKTKYKDQMILRIAKNDGIVLRNVNRLNDLVNDLLDVAKIDNREIVLHKEKMDLVQRMDSMVNIQFAKKIKEKEIKIKFLNFKEDSTMWIYADKLRLNQILSNRIDNAIKFSDVGGIISISIKIKSESNIDNKEEEESFVENQLKESDNSKEKYIIVSISDTGKRIPLNIKSRLFERFSTHSETGTGLGLYVSKKLVEAHGGRIWAFNNIDYKGATFGFSLPLIKDAKNEFKK